jgi:Xaa-Pro aminopeptidase
VAEAILIFGDSERSTDLFAAVGAAIIDPFLYAEVDGRRLALIGALDHQTIRAVDDGIELEDPRSFGTRELTEAGMPRREATCVAVHRFLTAIGATSGRVSWEFPVALADHLRKEGFDLTVDPTHFEHRRRAKTPAQIAGIRRAQRAADAAMGVAHRLVHACEPGLTAEAVRAAMQATCAELETTLDDSAIVAVNEQSANGHDSGSGPIGPGDTVLIDMCPRDDASRCFTDMTRTFVAGDEPPGLELAEYWSLSKDALELVTAAVRPGVNGKDLHAIAAEVFEEAGKPTARTQPPGQVLNEGFFHSLGHGVGLDIHEAPALGLIGDDLVAGDVIAVEPGCYRLGYGGVRLEDLLLVTDDGCEVLTQFAYDL